ncbi:MAG: 2-oxo-4-hydroxy-4-carboxy-5-ureidoimidazoline decarboxylase, partial [Ignavibacteria bacterium]
MNHIERLNQLSNEESEELFAKCCGAKRWISKMTGARPFRNEHELIECAERIWTSLDTEDRLEAFRHHPKIGDINSLKGKYSSTK